MKFIAATSSSDYKSIFSVDFAKKLLFLGKTYSPELISGQYDLRIYSYFNAIFGYIDIDTKNLESLGIIDPDYVKEICDNVFNADNDFFRTSRFGGGEFPFIAVYRDGSGTFYYGITR